MGGMTALSCMISTFVEGLLGGLMHSILIKRGRTDLVFSPFTAGAVTCVAELIQMLIILLIARPFDSARCTGAEHRRTDDGDQYRGRRAVYAHPVG